MKPEDELVALKTAYDILGGKFEEQKTRIASLETSLAAARREVEEIRQRWILAEADRDRLQAEVEAERRAFANLAQQFTAARDELNEEYRIRGCGSKPAVVRKITQDIIAACREQDQPIEPLAQLRQAVGEERCDEFIAKAVDSTLDACREQGGEQQNNGNLWRKKPVVIQAWQYDGTSECGMMLSELSTNITPYSGKLSIMTLEGVMEAQPGDWIIKGVKGEFYPCKPDIFAATYEPARPADAQEGGRC